MKLVKMIRSTYSFFSLLIFFLYSAQLAVNANLRVKREEKCYDELGCFENGGDFFDPVTRPIDVLPQDRDVLNTKFHLYTTKNKEDYDDLDLDDKDTITDSSFIPSADTKILVHGHSGNFKAEKWLEELKDKYLEKGDYNVIIVDWSEANVVPFYQAAANARVVGAEIALLVQYLQELKGIKPENVHIIGHSLGSQVAGYAGERLEKLGRITALDPPGPYFTNTAKKVRLDRGDADFVDVIHTDSIVGLGTREAVGHIDFYPNGGDHQPGCLIQPISTLFTEGVEQGVRRLFACDHLRSIDYYIEALDNEKCTPVGIACDNWNKYLDGECSDCGDAGQKCVMVGPQAETYREFKNDKKGKNISLRRPPLNHTACITTRFR
ncbi:pancreatic triacylglycerol lipase-like [Tachypleus tridentatus]|uniref:pancreatic triacylglycerol lipase-like n=1 Tax=Tachypleus tridentatus TaxID=6853 RepID=UPI003FD004A0